MFGAWVEIESRPDGPDSPDSYRDRDRELSGDKGLKNRFRIVGGEELIGAKDYISMDSPMALALMKKEVGDEAIVETPSRQFVWRITKIEYQK